jgi:hypothetical protein
MSNNEYTPEHEPDQGSGTEETAGTAAPPGTDFVTRLTGGGVLAKQWVRKTTKGKPTCIPYDRLSTFNARMVPVTGLVELAKVLDDLNQHQAVIHGGLIDREIGEPAKNIPRWLYPRGEDAPATIREAAHYWVLLDVDGIPCMEELDPIGGARKRSSPCH